ncbi:hypothetical protein PsYK624_158070 [Phanerochaete sordida]|uniref:Uncharacterized protein n=1 Tax=Phanerochaete sordida TaxID=48140 RepID=A0A9P3GTI8_9APHY|nr:hypothetical protein PsYK624_158070 [Phanerochaete sordida]
METSRAARSSRRLSAASAVLDLHLEAHHLDIIRWFSAGRSIHDGVRENRPAVLSSPRNVQRVAASGNVGVSSSVSTHAS